jgi:tRNA A37 threonylcarbamoyltransferase TsaD
MEASCRVAGLRLVVPPPDLCTDNAAMIAAYPRLARGQNDPFGFDTLSINPTELLSD